MNLLDRKIPANIQAEQMLLGSILINQELINNVNEFLRAEHFFEVIHQKIYAAIGILIDKGVSVEPVTLKGMLDRDPIFADLDETDYFKKLASLAMVVINSYDYGRIIYDLAMKRQLIALGQDLVNRVYDSAIDIKAQDLIDEHENKLSTLVDTGLSNHIGETLAQASEIYFQRLKDTKNTAEYDLATGFFCLDNMLQGLRRGTVIIIAGRTSMGKTAFALNIAYNIACALDTKHKAKATTADIDWIVFFSLEMKQDELLHRLYTSKSKIDSAKIDQRNFSVNDYEKLVRVNEGFKDLPLYIIDRTPITISSIKSYIRRLKKKYNVRLIFIDYLTLIKTTSSNRNYTRTNEVSEISVALKELAKEFDVTLIVLSQLSRATELRDDKRPRLSDLRESGSVEQDADAVILLYRESYYTNDKTDLSTEVIVAKNRRGKTGTVKFRYDADSLAFEETTQKN